MNKQIEKLTAEFVKSLAAILGRKPDRRGEWWGRLSAAQRSEVGQKAARTRRRNAKKTNK